jgi:prevent-host-death family protein
MTSQDRNQQVVGAFEAKTNLSRYIADAERGVVTLITVRGRLTAKLVPAAAEIVQKSFDLSDLIEKAGQLRSRTKPGPETMHDLVNAGRR